MYGFSRLPVLQSSHLRGAAPHAKSPPPAIWLTR
jgi:hypothetical protein